MNKKCMTKNLIDADKAIDFINAQKMDRESRVLTYNDGLQCAINIMNDLLNDTDNDKQTWELIEEFDSVPKSGIYKCSCCGKEISTCCISNYRYCYQCGSEMKI